MMLIIIYRNRVWPDGFLNSCLLQRWVVNLIALQYFLPQTWQRYFERIPSCRKVNFTQIIQNDHQLLQHACYEKQNILLNSVKSLCSWVVTIAISHVRGSGFNSRSRQARLRLPFFWGRWSEQQLLNSVWLLLKIAIVNHKSGKSAGHASLATWKFISPVGFTVMKRTLAPLHKSEYSTAYDQHGIYRVKIFKHRIKTSMFQSQPLDDRGAVNT